MNIRFDGKRALVTGAGQGIGYEIAKALVNCGAETFALSRTQANLDKLKAEVPAVHVVCVDLTDWEATRTTVDGLGRIDLLVNNAGLALLDTISQVTSQDIDMTLEVNVKAAISMIQVVSKGMIERGTGGSIVNMSSQASMRGIHEHVAYCASKGAIDQVTRTCALELGPHNIRVNSVNPTVVMTEMGKRIWTDPAKAGPMLSRIPLGRFATVEDVVNPTLFLLSDKAAMISGVTLPVDGGFLAC